MKQKFFLLFIFCAINWMAQAQRLNIDKCRIYGKMFIVQDKTRADFSIYVDDSEGLADIIVYQHSNKFYADRPGQWFFTPNRAEADFWVFIETTRGYADFIIAYTQTESFAGCK